MKHISLESFLKELSQAFPHWQFSACSFYQGYQSLDGLAEFMLVEDLARLEHMNEISPYIFFSIYSDIIGVPGVPQVYQKIINRMQRSDLT